jgi:DUF4097 and DUF4098 domain-containing protein YvlB
MFSECKGAIEQCGADKYNVSGMIEKTGPTTLEVTELPVRMWTQTYKEFLETLLNGTEKTQPFIKVAVFISNLIPCRSTRSTIRTLRSTL